MIKKIMMFAVAFALVACEGEDLSKVNKPNGGGNMPTGENRNANDARTQREYGRLEFPRLKSGANRVLLHATTNGVLNFAIEWNDTKKAQRWSCYQLFKSNMMKNTDRYKSDSNQYPVDSLLPKTLWFTSDPYWRTGYDHGHICPSADRLNSAEANYQTFYITNMQPQVHGFNAGVWQNMENKVREIASRNGYSFCDTLYICKGGTIDKPEQVLKTVGKGLIVPKYFFMALLRVKNGVYNAMGFWIEHKASDDKRLAKYAVSIKELEEKTGIDFFCNLPDNIENTIENAAVNNTFWGLD
jgi:DNA/RNA non-specific endonuclease